MTMGIEITEDWGPWDVGATSDLERWWVALGFSRSSLTPGMEQFLAILIGFIVFLILIGVVDPALEKLRVRLRTIPAVQRLRERFRAWQRWRGQKADEKAIMDHIKRQRADKKREP